MKTFDVLLPGLPISCENLILLGTSVARLNLSNSPQQNFFVFRPLRLQ